MAPVESIGSPALWSAFTALVLAMLALDLGVFHRTAHEVHFKEALAWSGVWVGLALAVNLLVLHHFGAERGLEFLTGYLIEKALSIDNIFVFVVVFSSFGVPLAYQHRVLFWGILGALVMRAVLIVAGVALLQRFHWILYVFGAFLLVTGVKLLVRRDAVLRPEQNPVYRLFRRAVPSVAEYRGSRFTVVENGRRHATPLLAVLVVVEATDLVFAVDSIPAIFAVTRDPFIVYASNVLAILGLRALYFLLAAVMGRFHYLKVGLAGVLCFVGLKMLVVGVYSIPIAASLAVIASLLAGSVAASLVWPRAVPPRAPAALEKAPLEGHPTAAPTS